MSKRNFLIGKILIVLLVSIATIAALAVGEAFAKEKKNITIVLWRGHTKAEDGFQKVINEAYDVNWAELNADQDKNKLEEIFKSIDITKIDLLYIFGSTSAKKAKELFKNANIPIVFSITYDPVRQGLVESWERSGCNMFGGSTKVQASAQINMLRKVLNFKRLGVIYNPKEENSVMSLKDIEASQTNLGFVVIPAVFSSPEELESAMRVLDEGKVEAAVCTASSMLSQNAEAIANELIKRKLPSLSQVIETAEKGILLGLGVDYERLGEEVGKVALRVLKGEKPSDMPTIALNKYNFTVNTKTADKIGLKISPDVLKIATKIIK